jgi:hypothetical protein
MTMGTARPRHERRYNRLAVEAACARMNPDPDKLRATIDAFTRRSATAGYWPLVVNTTATAINTIHVVHATECDRPGCGTCAAISLAVTATAAHYALTGGPR